MLFCVHTEQIGAKLLHLLVLTKMRRKMKRIDDGRRPSILVNKKGPIKALIYC
jgi:hypothetical protein